MLKGSYVGLRAIEQSDLSQLLSWRNNPKLRRFFREYRELNHTQQLDWFTQTVNNDISTKMFSIIDLNSNKLLGACGLCYIDWINRTADFSLYIGDKDVYIDSKYAPDAAKILINYGFGELSLNRLWSEIYSFDLKKRDSLIAVGFKHEGTFRQTHWSEGNWCDSIYYAILKADII